MTEARKMNDPYPEFLLLTERQTAGLLAMNRTTFRQFMKDESSERFPRARVIGKSRNGKPRLVWVKEQVYAWFETI